MAVVADRLDGRPTSSRRSSPTTTGPRCSRSSTRRSSGKEIVAPPEVEEAPSGAIDLMAALRASVERAKAARTGGGAAGRGARAGRADPDQRPPSRPSRRRAAQDRGRRPRRRRADEGRRRRRRRRRQAAGQEGRRRPKAAADEGHRPSRARRQARRPPTTAAAHRPVAAKSERDEPRPHRRRLTRHDRARGRAQRRPTVERAVGVLGAEPLLVELADRGLRHRLDERPPLRQLPAGDRAWPGSRAARSAVTDCALAEHDRREWTLAPPLVRHADDARLEHRRVRHQRVLQLDRADPLAAGLDDVLGPVGQGQVAVRGEHADVAGAQPAVAELLRVGLGVAEVGLGDPRARGPRARRPTCRRRASPRRPGRRCGPRPRPAPDPGCSGRPRPPGRSGRPAAGTPSRAATSRSCPRRG